MRSWAFFLVAACAPQAAAPIMTVAPSTPMPSVRPSEDPPPAAPTAIEIGCSYATDALHFARATAICATRDTDCFANLGESIYGKLGVMVPLGAVTHFVGVLELGAARLRGQFRSDDVLAGLSGPTPIDGWIIPVGMGSVRIDRAKTGAIDFAVVHGDDLQPMGPLGASWACDRVAFTHVVETADAEAALVPESQRTHALRFLASNVVLSREPGGDGVAHYGTNGTEVELLEARGAYSRILGHALHAVFVAWVPSHVLLPYSAGAGYGSGHGRLGGYHSTSGTRCKRDIPLYARVGSKLVRVGDIMNGHQFDVQDVDGKKIVDVRARTAFTLLPGVTLEITPEDLEACVR